MQRIFSFFFAKDSEESRGLSLRNQYLLLFLFYALTRLLTSWVCLERGASYLANDPGNYIAEANYISIHHQLATEDSSQYRQFPGLSILMALLNPLVGNMLVTGYLITTVSSLAAVGIFHHLFRDFRMSLAYCIFLPWWIVANYTVSSEGPTMACFMIGLWAIRDGSNRPALMALGLLVCGFGIVVRQTALFSVLPLVAVYQFMAPRGGILRVLQSLALLSLPFVAYLAFNWQTIHVLFPQYRIQHEASEEFLRELTRHPDYYGDGTFSWPFHSLLAGVMDDSQSLLKKLSVLFSVAATALAILALGQRTLLARRIDERALFCALTAALAGHFFFHMCVGNLNGFRWQDRYLSQVSQLIDIGLFYQRPLRWGWLALLTLGGLLFAMNCGYGNTPFLFFK